MKHASADLAAATRYREKAAELGGLRDEISRVVEQSNATGDTQRAQELLGELTLRTKELHDLAAGLGPEGIFLAKYGVEVVNDHTVALVIPRLCSHMEIVDEAVRILSRLRIVEETERNAWAQLTRYYDLPSEQSRMLCIDLRVEELAGMTRRAQVDTLKERGLEMPSLKDLAIAYTAFFVATGEHLLGRGMEVRARGGVLGVSANGILSVASDQVSRASPSLAAAALLPAKS